MPKSQKLSGLHIAAIVIIALTIILAAASCGSKPSAPVEPTESFIQTEATLKRVRLFNDHISLEPENPMYKPLVYWNEDMNTVRILGKAVAFTSAVR